MVRKRIIQGGTPLRLRKAIQYDPFGREGLIRLSHSFTDEDESMILGRLVSLHLMIPNYRGGQNIDLMLGEYNGNEQVIMVGHWNDGVETEQDLQEINNTIEAANEIGMIDGPEEILTAINIEEVTNGSDQDVFSVPIAVPFTGDNIMDTINSHRDERERALEDITEPISAEEWFRTHWRTDRPQTNTATTIWD